MKMKSLEVSRPYSYGKGLSPLEGKVTLESELGSIVVQLSPDTLRAIIAAVRVQVQKSARTMAGQVTEGFVEGDRELIALAAPVERVEG